jgi:hypothetical protein
MARHVERQINVSDRDVSLIEQVFDIMACLELLKLLEIRSLRFPPREASCHLPNMNQCFL